MTTKREQRIQDEAIFLEETAREQLGSELAGHNHNGVYSQIGHVHAYSSFSGISGTINAPQIDNERIVLRMIHASLRNPAQSAFGLRTIAALLGGDATSAASGNHSHGAGDTSSFELLPAGERRRSLAQRLTIRRKLRDFKPIKDKQITAEDHDKLLSYVHLLASQVQTLSHLLQDAPDRDGFAREKAFKRGEIDETNIFFEYRHSERAEEEGRHIALLDHEWTVNAHPDLAV